MKRLVLSVLTLAVLAVPALAQNSGLKRLTMREDMFGWEAVGRVAIGDRGYCTGVLIAPDLVLTAAHCVFGDNGAPLASADLVFRAGERDGQSIAERQVSSFVAHPNYVPGGGTTLQNIRVDAALLKLQNPIPAAEAAPFPVSGTRADKVNVVSYARGRDAALSQQRVCGILGRQDGLFAFDCDVYFGSSGAPVFDMTGNRGRIVALVSAGSRSERRTVSFGMELPQVVDALKTSLRTGRGVAGSHDQQTQLRRLKVGARDDTGQSRFLRP